MTAVLYRDELGYVSVETDGSGVDFVDGEVIFSDADGNVLVINVESLVRVEERR